MRRLWSTLGPGLLWAGTAVGVSHLVQSTRAGASFGLGLLWLVLLANLVKYPAFEAGPRYAAATKTSLLEGYRRQGLWALVLFLFLTVGTMFTVLAGVTIVTAGMASALITDAISPVAWSAILLFCASVMLVMGRFQVLELFMKAMMLVLTVSTACSVVVLLPQVSFSELGLMPVWPGWDKSSLMFMAAVAGWMPSAIDTAVWQSLWGLEKERTTGAPYTPKTAALDFNIGYIGTVLLALMFLFLGSAVLFGQGTEIPSSGVAFASLLIDVYAKALGDWARPLIMVAAFSTMISTTLAVADGFPRALDGAVARLWTKETELTARSSVYYGGLVLCGLGALTIISMFAGSLKDLVDMATTMTGLTAPGLALLNLVVLRGPEVPDEAKPTGAYLVMHVIGIVALTIMACLYCYARFVL